MLEICNTEASHRGEASVVPVELGGWGAEGQMKGRILRAQRVKVIVSLLPGL